MQKNLNLNQISAVSDCFLSLDDKSKQRYKVKINNYTRVRPTSAKNGKNSQSILINKFPLVQ